MRKAKLPLAVLIVLVAVMLAFAGCVNDSQCTLILHYGDGDTETVTLEGDPPTIETAPEHRVIAAQNFDGWFLDQELTRALTYPYSLEGVSELTLYPSYSAGYTVTLSGGYGASEIKLDIDDNVIRTQPDPGVSPDGSYFGGWYLDSGFTQAATFPLTVNAHTTLYANWTGEASGFVVTFVTNGGTPIASMVTERIDTAPVSTREGYTLSGWYTNEALSGRAVRFPYTVTSDVTLYAAWTENVDPNTTYTTTSSRAPYTAFTTLFEEYGQAVGGSDSDLMTIDLAADVEGGTIELIANLMYGEEVMKANDLYFKVSKDDGTGFGVYITDNRMFVDVGGENGLYEITEVQADYMALIISRLPSVIQDLIASSGIEGALGMFGGLDGLIGIVFGMFFEDARITEYRLNGDDSLVQKDYSIEFKLNSFTDGITEILDLIDLGTLLGFDLNIGELLNWIKGAIPEHEVIITTSFSYDSEGNISVRTQPGIDATYNDPDGDNYGEPSWNFRISDIVLGEAVSIDFPDNVDGAISGGIGSVQEFSFTNLQFDIDLLLLTGSESDGNGGTIVKELDVASLIGMFTDEITLPEGMIKLQSEFGFKLRAKVDLDLNYSLVKNPDGSLVDNNLILLELWTLDASGNMQDKALGIYYKEGNLYVSLSDLVPNYWKAQNIVVGLDGLPEIIAGIVTTVRTAIDEALGLEYGQNAATGLSGVNISTSTANQLALADGEEGGYQLSPTLASFIQAINATLAIPENVLYVEGDRIVLNVEKLEGSSNDIFDVIDNFMNIAGQDPISGLIPDGISGKLELIFFEGGLKSIDITGNIAPSADEGLTAVLSINNFLIGVEDGGLEEAIDEGIGDADGYTSNLGELLSSALAGIDINMNIDLTFDAGTYSLGGFLAGLGLGELEGIPLNWTFENDFDMNLTLTVQMSLTEENPMLLVEVVAEEPIYIGGAEQAQPAGLLLGLYGYYEEGVGYVALDLSNIVLAGIGLPQFKAELDFYGLVMGLLDDLKIDFGNGEQAPGDIDLSFDISGLLGGDSSASGDSSATQAFAENIVENPGESLADTELTPAGSILVGLNSEKLYANFTLAAVLELLETMGVDLGSVNLGSIDLAGGLELSRLDGITLTLDGTLMQKVNTSGSTDQNLHLTLQTGTEDFPFTVGSAGTLAESIEAKKADLEQYRSDLLSLVIETIAKSHISLEMDLRTLDSHMDLTAIINNILASQGQKLDLPIDMYIDDWDPTVTLDIGWELVLTEDGNIDQTSKISLSLVYNGKELFGVGLEDGDAIVRLKGLGLFNMRLADSKLISSLITLIQNAIDSVGNMSLSELLDSLLSSINGDPVDIDPAAAASAGDTSAADGGTTSGDVDPADDTSSDTPAATSLDNWVVVLLQSISAKNTTIIVDLTMDMVDEIVRGLAGFSLGLDIGAIVEVDFVDGEISLDLQINDNIDFGATMAIAINDPSYTVDTGTDATTIDGTSGTSIAQGLFDSLELSLSLDVLNNTPDTSNANTYLRLRVEKLQTQTALANTGGYVAPRGTFLITIQQILGDDAYNNTQSGNVDSLIYAVFDYNASTITIKMKEGWIQVLSGLVDVGSIINDQNLSISLASTDANGNSVGIIEQIGALLDGLISDLESMTDPDAASEETPTEGDGTSTGGDTTSGGDTSTTDASTGLDMSPLTDLFAQLDVMELLSGGIDINFNATGTFNLDIAFDPYTINKLIDDMMNLIFGPNSILDLGVLAPEMFTQHHLRNVTWSRTGGFWDSLKQVIIDDMVPDIVSSPTVTAAVGIDLSGLLWMFSGTLDNVLETVKPIITAILPFPIFNEINAGVNFVDGTLANLYITGYDNNQPVTSSDGTQTLNYPTNRNTNNKMEIWIYNQFSSVGAPDNVTDGSQAGIVDWGEIPKTVIFDPYEYTAGSAGNQEFIAEYFTGKTARYQNGSHVMRSDVTFTVNGTEISQAGIDFYEIARTSTEDTRYTVTVSADFSGQSRSIEIELVIRPLKEIDHIEPIEMYAYDSMPDYLTLTFTDGTSRSVSWEAVRDYTFAPSGYTKHSVDGTVTFRNGSTGQITVDYRDSTAANLIGSDGLTMSVDLYNMTQADASITAYTPETLFFNYPDGAAVAMDVDRWENTEELNAALAERALNPTDMSAISGEIVAVIGAGTGAEQRITISVSIRTKNVTSVRYGEFRNAIQLNPYDIYLQEIYPDDPSYTVLPTEATAYYNEDGDSYSETVYINVALTDPRFDMDSIGWNSSTQTTADVSLDKSKYGGYYGWTIEDVPVNVVLNRISKIWFADADSETGYSSTFKIDPYVYNSLSEEEKQAYFPTEALVEFSNGETRTLPIRFPDLDVNDLYIDYDGFNDQYRVEIGFAIDDTLPESEKNALENRFLQSTYVFFEIEGKEIASYNIAGYDGNAEEYFIIDPVAVLLQGQAALPVQVEVVYTDGTTETISVDSWERVAISLDGSTGTVTGNLTTDGRNAFQIKYKVLTRINPTSETIVFDSYDYTYGGGAISFDVLTDTIAVTFEDETGEEYSYYLDVYVWETGAANFGSGEDAGGTVRAIFHDSYNNAEEYVDIALEAQTSAPTGEISYLGLDYLFVSSTMGEDGRLTSVFDNFSTTDIANRAVYGTTISVQFTVNEIGADGEITQRTVWRVLKADLLFGVDVPTDADTFNNYGYTAYNYNSSLSPEEQRASKFEVTINYYDGSNTVAGTTTMDVYFGYAGPADSGVTA